MSCCSVTKARRKLGRQIQKGVLDPVRKEAKRIERKVDAEVGRVPNNIDKGLSSAGDKIGSSIRGGVRNIRETLSDVLDIIPGLKGLGQFAKFVGIGIVLLIGVSIIRRARK